VLLQLSKTDRQVDLKIGELAKATGKTQRALRLYEELGLLTPGTRTAGNFRVYDDKSVERVTWIGKLQELGFTLHDIKELLPDETAPKDAMRRVRAIFEAKQAEVALQIERLQQLQGELVGSLAYLETCVDKCADERCSACHTHDDRAPALVESLQRGERRS
jgi:DNA-binding transcriptional MerR regulator